MGMRVLAAAALSAGTLVVLAAPAPAQTYPPPVRSITVDDATPAAGQAVRVTLRTCKPSTRALFGVDLLLLGSARVGRDGVAVGTIRIPALLPPGRHAVVGICLAPDNTPLVLRTDVTVTPGPATPTPGGAVPPAAPGGGAVPPAAPGGGAVPPSGGGGAPPMPGLGTLGSARGPVDPVGMFAQAGTAAGVPGDPVDRVPAGGGTPTAGSGFAPDRGAAATSHSGTGGAAGDPSAWATAGRVALGLAALGGVPVAMAFNRSPRAAARRRFA
jgi:hypothetical protein